MENLKIEQTESTLGVKLDLKENILNFFGESRPENCPTFFNPIITWIKGYNKYLYYKINEYKVKELRLTVDFKVTYFNSTSAKYILEIIQAINALKAECPTISIDVNWHYKSIDEDMLDSGEEFISMSGLPMNLIAID